MFAFLHCIAAVLLSHTFLCLQVLSDDYSKIAFLCTDRSIHFHAKFGSYYSTRVPSFGRDLAYAPFSADLLVVGSAPEVYRLNLAEGRSAPLAVLGLSSRSKHNCS